MTAARRRLRWLVSNRVVAQPITAQEVGWFRPGDFIDIGGELRRVHRIDNARLVLSVY